MPIYFDKLPLQSKLVSLPFTLTLYVPVCFPAILREY